MTKRDHLLSNELYDILKLLALIIFPALGTLYYTLAQIWGFGGAEQVVGSIVAFDTFLGVIIKLGDVSYNASEGKFDGHMQVHETEGTKTFALELNKDPEELEGQKQVTFKVRGGESVPSA